MNMWLFNSSAPKHNEYVVVVVQQSRRRYHGYEARLFPHPSLRDPLRHASHGILPLRAGGRYHSQCPWLQQMHTLLAIYKKKKNIQKKKKKKKKLLAIYLGHLYLGDACINVSDIIHQDQVPYFQCTLHLQPFFSFIRLFQTLPVIIISYNFLPICLNRPISNINSVLLWRTNMFLKKGIFAKRTELCIYCHILFYLNERKTEICVIVYKHSYIDNCLEKANHFYIIRIWSQNGSFQYAWQQELCASQ